MLKNGESYEAKNSLLKYGVKLKRIMKAIMRSHSFGAKVRSN